MKKKINENEFIKTNMVLNDRRHWTNIDGKVRNLIIYMGPIRYSELDFPKDVNNRHFSKSAFTKWGKTM